MLELGVVRRVERGAIMILNSKFVYIHLPKTGGTFVTKILDRLHPRFNVDSRFSRGLERLAILTGQTGNFIIDTTRYRTKHGHCKHIPKRFLNKPIFSTVRNPYDHYVSHYEFSQWKRYPQSFFVDLDEVLKFCNCQNLDQISFEDFVRVINSTLSKPFAKMKENNIESESIGMRTHKFVNSFFKNPEKIFRLIHDESLSLEQYKQEMFPVSFLRTETLNQDLYKFLVNIGYDSEKVDFILNEGKIYPHEGGREENASWQKYYSPELKNFVRNRENLLFSLFPEYDI